MNLQAGWQQPPKQPTCSHIGALFAALGAQWHEVGHEWLCTCGKRFVVRRATTDDGRSIKRLEAKR